MEEGEPCNYGQEGDHKSPIPSQHTSPWELKAKSVCHVFGLLQQVIPILENSASCTHRPVCSLDSHNESSYLWSHSIFASSQMCGVC